MISAWWLLLAFLGGIAFTVLAIWLFFKWIERADDDDWMGL